MAVFSFMFIISIEEDIHRRVREGVADPGKMWSGDEPVVNLRILL